MYHNQHKEYHWAEKFREFIMQPDLQNLSASHEFYQNLPQFGVNDRESPYVTAFYEAYDNENSGLMQTYDDFLRTEIFPLFPKEEELVVQATPNARFHVRGNTNIGVLPADPPLDQNIIGLHRDSDFGHPPEEWNFVIPVTPMYGSNTVWYETAPYAMPLAEFLPITMMDTSQFFQAHLNTCRHFNQINTTPNSRVSMDFRVTPGSKYHTSNSRSKTKGQKFQIGAYYKLLTAGS